MSNPSKIAIIGAGLSGLTAAKALAHDFEVTVFEKSRGVGGRLSTRYAGAFEFDHGAQYFTAKSPSFTKLVKTMETEGIVAAWQGDFVELMHNNLSVPSSRDHTKYVGVPRMNAVGKYLARGLSIVLNQRVAQLIRGDGFWQLTFEEGAISEKFDWVIFAIPADQAQPLLPSDSPLSTEVCAVEMQGCHVLMLGGDDNLRLPNWHAANISNSCIQWISCNSSKPGRSAHPTLVIVSDNDWAQANIDTDHQQVQNLLWVSAAELLGLSSHHIVHRSLHHWRYAKCVKSLQSSQVLDKKNHLGLCGDWTQGPNVEAAYLSGEAVAQELKKHLLA